MKTKIKYSVLFYDGRKSSITQTLDFPDFEEINHPPILDIKGDKISDGHTETIESQIDTWLSEVDKKDFMDKKTSF